MEPEKEKAPVELSGIEAINNLDTARMALRWALERLHGVEKDRADLSEKALREAQRTAGLDEACRALQRTLALRSEEIVQHELYYKKMEEFLSMRISGKLDVAALAKREVETTRLMELLEARQTQLEKDYAAKRESLESEQARLRMEVQQDAKLQASRGEESLAQRRGGLEKEHAAKAAELHEKEVWLKLEERSLSERQAQFEEFYAARRLELEREMKAFRDQVEDQVGLRLQNSERLLTERHDFLERGWLQEKTLLLKEIHERRREAQERLDRILELEKSVAAAESALKQAQKERDILAADSDQWKTQIKDSFESSLRTKRRLVEAEEAARGAAETSALELERRKALQEREKVLAAEHQSRLAESQAEHRALQEALEAAHGSHLAELEQAAAETNRRHALVLDEQRKSWERDKAVLLQESSQWRLKAQEQLPRILDLEKRLAAAEEAARGAAEISALEQERRKAVEEREKSAAADYRSRLAELDAKNRERQEALDRRESELERRSAELAEDLRSKLLSAETMRSEMDRGKTAALAELAHWKDKAQAAAPRILELERGLAAADEDRLSWESGKAGLEAQLKKWRDKAHEQLSRAGEFEKRLEAAITAALSAKESAAIELERRNALEERDRASGAAFRNRLSELEASGVRREEALLEREKELERRSGELAQRYRDYSEELRRQLESEGRRHAALLEEERRAWQKERAALLEELVRPPAKEAQPSPPGR